MPTQPKAEVGCPQSHYSYLVLRDLVRSLNILFEGNDVFFNAPNGEEKFHRIVCNGAFLFYHEAAIYLCVWPL